MLLFLFFAGRDEHHVLAVVAVVVRLLPLVRAVIPPRTLASIAGLVFCATCPSRLMLTPPLRPSRCT